jgi:hypothetical protein
MLAAVHGNDRARLRPVGIAQVVMTTLDPMHVEASPLKGADHLVRR